MSCLPLLIAQMCAVLTLRIQHCSKSVGLCPSCLFASPNFPVSSQAKDRLYQFNWRPRLPSLLPPEREAEITKNLRAYSKRYEEEDEAMLTQVRDIDPQVGPAPEHDQSLWALLQCTSKLA